MTRTAPPCAGSVPGDNTKGSPADQAANDVGGIAADQLRSFIERIERLEMEKAQIQADIKDVYAAAKSDGFCTKTMRKLLQIRKMEPHERAEQEELLDLYLSAVGY